MHGRLRRRPHAVHHDHRDGRPGRCPRLPGLRPDQPLWRLVRHAGGPRLHASARRACAHRGARRRGADQHAAAAVLPTRFGARLQPASQRLRGRRRVPQGLPQPRRPFSRAHGQAQGESSDRERDAPAHRCSRRHPPRSQIGGQRRRRGVVFADGIRAGACDRCAGRTERFPGHARAGRAQRWRRRAEHECGHAVVGDLR